MAIRDAVHLRDDAALSTEVCIVGGGPAGISLALALSGVGVPAVLLESGGHEQTAEDQDLNAGTNAGLPYYDLDFTRHRGLGGGSNRWAGWSRPLDPEDFSDEPPGPFHGWPISYEDMAPFYDEAARLCEIPSLADEDLDGLPAVYRPPFVGGGIGVATWKGSPPTKFGIVYREEMDASRTLDVYLHATVVGVDVSDDGTTVRGVRAVGPGGRAFTVTARTVVICVGAIETPRLLLASNEVHADGIGNANDLVGRTFMEHPHLVTARIVVLPPEVTGRAPIDGIDRSLGGVRDRLAMQRPSGSRKAAYVVDPAVRRELGTLNFSTHIQTVSNVDRSSSEAYQAFKLVVGNLRSPSRVVEQVRTRSLPEGTGEQVRRLAVGLPEITRVVWEEAVKRPTELALYTQCEQRPNSESRVTLDHRARDATGLPRLVLEWRLSAEDKRSVMDSHSVLGEQFMASGLGVVVPEEPFRDDGPDWGPGLRGGHHHMGTARMSHDPSAGVVDPDGQVHGVAGLYIGDSSVFPTVGYANPLLTTVAHARRLGAHLIRRAAARPVEVSTG